jgi:hypothetical protein
VSDDTPSGADELSLFELRFVEAYMGEAGGVGSRAVELAGGTSNPRSAAAIACEILKRPRVKEALRERGENDPLVAGRLERLRFLTKIMRGEVEEVRSVVVLRKAGQQVIERVYAPPSIADRMAAAQALAKAAGEHLAVDKGDEDLTRLVAKLASMSVAEMFELSRGGTTQ